MVDPLKLTLLTPGFGWCGGYDLHEFRRPSWRNIYVKTASFQRKTI